MGKKEDKDDGHRQNEQEQGSFLKLPAMKLTLMIIIVDWNNIKKAESILQEQWVRYQYVSVGKGTANSEILDVLGIGASDKGILFCLQPDFRVSELMRIISVKLGLASPGKGIAFTIPLSGAANPAAQIFNEEQLTKLIETLEPEKRERILYLFSQEAKERWETHMESELELEKSNTAGYSIHYDLILTVVNQGYSDELMDKAKEAGAGGGTIVSARRIGAETSVKFFGISVQEEKEIVAILSKRESKNAIMKAINQSYGLTTEARGIIFSLPVDDVVGLDFM